MGYAAHGWDYKRDPRPLLHGHASSACSTSRATCACCCSRRAAPPRSPARRAPAGASSRPARPTRVRGRAGGQVAAAQRARARDRHVRRAAAGDRAGPADAEGPRRQRAHDGAYRGALEFRAGHVRRHQRDQRGRRRRLRAGRRPARVAGVVADRGAQGAGRRRAHVRADDLARAAPASSTTRTRARRSTAARAPSSRRPTRRRQATAGQLVTYQGPPVADLLLLHLGRPHGERREQRARHEPQPWLRSVEDEYDNVSPKHRWGPIRMTMASAGAKLRGLVKGRFRGIKVLDARRVAADRAGRRRRLARAARG